MCYLGVIKNKKSVLILQLRHLSLKKFDFFNKWICFFHINVCVCIMKGKQKGVQHD